MGWHGRVAHLHLGPRAFLPMQAMAAISLVAGYGIEGDRYAVGSGFYSNKPEEGRQVTFFEEETLEALWRDHGVELSPADHRRNITTRGVPLNHLVGRHFRIGSVVVEATRLSVPCRHIEEITGKEIFNLILNRSGLNARILVGGIVRTGDPVVSL
ncbi:MOSC domain-containing protein [Methylobacterium sp. J-030]|uniref:MOSC domain-containing protein n=1 Tax=Methylobacterium sp. J-030 TaxID=2836627 RepID=UPI001FBA0AF8|nr:MOSC domain-containing protein [Methylobacterium sp. J-030]MCJ2071343.1 MOSC domain-containing protein [Methylobacterium sp. J-030]